MTKTQRLVLGLSGLVIVLELLCVAYYFEAIADWLSHNLWIVVVPFLKSIVRKLLALKLVAVLKALSILLWNILKLLLLKLFKTLGLRYGVFFSQHRWYWVRKSKVMFLRRGKQFFRITGHFWNKYRIRDKWIILIAFFPVALVLYLLGLSFNITRKTMVRKTQEAAIFQAAANAGNSSHGVRAWIDRLDKQTLEKIRGLSGQRPLPERHAGRTRK